MAKVRIRRLDTLQNWEIARVSPPPYLRRALADLARELDGAPSP